MSKPTAEISTATSGANGLNGQGIVMRSDMGPAIAGTRISVYDIMDYLHEEWAPNQIRDWLGLTQAQIDAALAYFYANREQLEIDYQQLEKEQKESRQYWEQFNRNRPKPEPAPDSPEKATLRAT